MRILIAEDDADSALLVSTILQRAGHRTLLARDAMQTVMQARREGPDLIVLDLQMPAGTGAGALTKLKGSTHTAGIPVIVLTGVADPALEQQVLRDGALRFLRKPVDPDALLDAVASVAGQPRE